MVKVRTSVKVLPDTAQGVTLAHKCFLYRSSTMTVIGEVGRLTKFLFD